MKAERGEIGGNGAPDEDGAAVFLQNQGGPDIADHSAQGENERQNHAPHENDRKAVNSFRTPPDAGHKQESEKKAGQQARRLHAQKRRQRMLQHGPAAAYIGIDQGIKHKSDGETVERVPERAEKIFYKGVETVARGKFQVDFKNCLA